MAQSESALMPFRELPGPRGLPVLGNLHRIRLDRLHLILEDWAEQYGEIFRIRIGPYRIAVISDRAAIQRILVQRLEGFRRTVTLESAATEMRLNGVFAAESEDWRRQRRIVTAALNRARLKDFFPALAVTVGRLQRHWEQAADASEPVDLCRDLMRFTVDVTMQLAFGIDANTLETPGPVIQRHLDVWPRGTRTSARGPGSTPTAGSSRPSREAFRMIAAPSFPSGAGLACVPGATSRFFRSERCSRCCAGTSRWSRWVAAAPWTSIWHSR